MKPRRNRAGNTVWMSWKGKPEDAKPPHYIYGAGWDLCKCPYGQPGDRLWVRETYSVVLDSVEAEGPGHTTHVEFRADTANRCPGDWPADEARGNPDAPKWVPSIHMPRHRSRIQLEIVSVRVERLQDISEADAKSEGVYEKQPTWWGWTDDGYHGASAKTAFSALWCSINGIDNWNANPWVWVVEFKRVTA